MRRLPVALLMTALTAIPAGGSSALHAQVNIPAALIGGVTGAGSGGYIAISVIVAQSRAGKYMHSFRDALGWQSAPVLIGGATGVFIGATSPDRLRRVIIYGSVGTVAGMGAGVVAGKLAWKGPEAKWAGGAIGSGIGMAMGSTLGLFLPRHKKTTTQAAAANAARIPISFTIRF